MKKLLKNKIVLQVVLLAVVIGILSTPVGHQYADHIQPIIDALVGM